MIAVAQSRALFNALLEAERRAKGLVFRPTVIAAPGSTDADIVFVAHFVEYADEAPPGQFWPSDEVPDAIAEAWSLACSEEVPPEVHGCSWCNVPGRCPDCEGEGKNFGHTCSTCDGRGACGMCAGPHGSPALPFSKARLEGSQ